MTTLYCLLAHLDDLPADPGWLSATERDTAHSLTVVKRRQDWLLGRYVAKRALGACLTRRVDELGRWEIRPASDGAPTAWRDGEPVATAISLSHSGGRAMCAVAPPDTAPGCDIERIESRGASFAETFFTEGECDTVAGAREEQQALLLTLIWSAKESALKSIRQGLRRDTRCVDVHVTLDGSSDRWQRLEIDCAPPPVRLHGWWRTDADFVLTVVADRQFYAPRLLDVEAP